MVVKIRDDVSKTYSLGLNRQSVLFSLETCVFAKASCMVSIRFLELIIGWICYPTMSKAPSSCLRSRSKQLLQKLGGVFVSNAPCYVHLPNAEQFTTH